MKAVLAFFIIMLALDTVKHSEPPQQLPLVKADYRLCIPVNTGPIEPRVNGSNVYPRRKDVA